MLIFWYFASNSIWILLIRQELTFQSCFRNLTNIYKFFVCGLPAIAILVIINVNSNKMQPNLKKSIFALNGWTDWSFIKRFTHKMFFQCSCVGFAKEFCCGIFTVFLWQFFLRNVCTFCIKIFCNLYSFQNTFFLPKWLFNISRRHTQLFFLTLEVSRVLFEFEIWVNSHECTFLGFYNL